jgi:hypothetical protein
MANENQYLELEIPVKPLVKNCLQKKYGETLVLSRKTVFEKCLIALLYRNASITINNFDTKKYSDTYKIKVSHKLAFDFGARSISNFTILTVNDFVEEFFINLPFETTFRTTQFIKHSFLEENKNSHVNFKKVNRNSLKISNIMKNLDFQENENFVINKLRSVYRNM